MKAVKTEKLFYGQLTVKANLYSFVVVWFDWFAVHLGLFNN